MKRPTRKRDRRKRPTKYTYRTTLSLDPNLANRLRKFALQERLSETEAARRAVELGLPPLKLQGPGSAGFHARQLLSLVGPMSNPYQDFAASWRLDRARRQLAEISTFALDLDAWSAELYLLRILAELLHQFGPDDEFLTVTNLDFWSEAYPRSGDAEGDHFLGHIGAPGDPGVPIRAEPPSRSALSRDSAAHYLTAQKEAIFRGMRLSRLILLSPKELKERTGDLLIHKRFLDEVRAHEAGRFSSRATVQYKVVDEIARERIGHFACIRRLKSVDRLSTPLERDDGCLVVEPEYRAGVISNLKLLFSRGSSSHDDPRVKFYIDRFFQASDAPGTKPLDDLQTAFATATP